MLFEDKIYQDKEAFIARLNEIADEFSLPPDAFMAVFNAESEVNPYAVNPYSGASGLIQFMPDTALDLGTTVHNIRLMPALAQLEYVRKYYLPYKDHITKFLDLYLITFYPNADGKFAGTLEKPGDWAFPEYVTKQNKALDFDGSGLITIDEFEQWAFQKIPQQYHAVLRKNYDTATKVAKRNWGKMLIVSGLVVGAVYLILKK